MYTICRSGRSIFAAPKPIDLSQPGRAGQLPMDIDYSIERGESTSALDDEETEFMFDAEEDMQTPRESMSTNDGPRLADTTEDDLVVFENQQAWGGSR